MTEKHRFEAQNMFLRPRDDAWSPREGQPVRRLGEGEKALEAALWIILERWGMTYI
jgi:hypothetical protein